MRRAGVHFISLLFLMTLGSRLVLAQISVKDSLLFRLKSDVADTTMLNHLNDLAYEYNRAAMFDSSKFYVNASLELNRKLSVRSKNPQILRVLKACEASAYRYLGVANANTGNYLEALQNHFLSLKIRDALGDKAGVANCYNTIGSVYNDLGNYPEALKNYFISLKIREELGDRENIAACYNNIGLAYSQQGNYTEALNYYSLCLRTKEGLGPKVNNASVFNNIGYIYQELGNYEEAMKHYLASLKIKEERGDKAGVANSFGSIGNVLSAQGKYKEALESFEKALKIRETIGQKKGIAINNHNIGNTYFRMGNRSKARSFILKSKEISSQIGFKQGLKDCYKTLSDIDSAQGNFRGAFENRKMYVFYRDSLNNEETRKQTIQSQMTYDFEKKEAVANAEHRQELANQNALSEERSRKQKTILVMVACGLLLVLVFAGFIFRSLRITRKQKSIIEEQKNIVELQKQEVEHQKLIVEEHQKDIIDSIMYARRIQRSLLPTEIYIEKNINRLKKK